MSGGRCSFSSVLKPSVINNSPAPWVGRASARSASRPSLFISPPLYLLLPLSVSPLFLPSHVTTERGRPDSICSLPNHAAFSVMMSVCPTAAPGRAPRDPDGAIAGPINGRVLWRCSAAPGSPHARAGARNEAATAARAPFA